MKSETLPVQCALSVAGVGWACRLHYEKTGKWPMTLVCQSDRISIADQIDKELKTGMLVGQMRDLPEDFWFVSSDEYVVFGHHGW